MSSAAARDQYKELAVRFISITKHVKVYIATFGFSDKYALII